MLRASVNADLLEHLAAERTLGHHAANRFVDGEFRLLVEKIAVAGLLQAAGITGVMVVFLLVKFAAGQHDLFGVDDDHMVAGVAMRRIYRLMFPAKDSGYLGSETAEHHSVSIHNIPLTFDGLAFCHIGFHGASS